MLIYCKRIFILKRLKLGKVLAGIKTCGALKNIIRRATNISMTTSPVLVFAQLQEIGGLPGGTCDLWMVTGHRPEAKFTWDLTRNDNLEWPHKFKPRCRFDRLYLRDARPSQLKPVYFELVGLERLKTCRRFCSDHWGLLAHFDKV